MQPTLTHPWNVTEIEALQLQRSLANKVIKEDKFDNIHLIAGVDIAYTNDNDLLIAAIVTLDANTLSIVESVTVIDGVQFPYIPGLFSFRELPPLMKAFEKLQHTPDLIVCDGQGYAHPRRFGLACHLGIIYDIPTFGCGKTRLSGNATVPDAKRGSSTPLVDQGEIIGSVLRTKTNLNLSMFLLVIASHLLQPVNGLWH